MENFNKWLPWVLVALLAFAIIGWLAPAYQKVTKQRDELQSQVTTLSNATHGVTIIEPVEVAGKVVYKTIYKTDTLTQSVTQTVTQIKEKEVTVTKRNIVSVGALWDFKDPMPKALTVDVNIFGPLGAQGQVQRDPWVGMVGVKFNF